MSLINDALKKAQRMRNEGAAAPSPGSGGPVVKRGQARSAKSMLFLAVGAVVLVVGSMVGTALWLTRPATPAPKVVAASASSPSPSGESPPAPLPRTEPAAPAASLSSSGPAPARPETAPASAASNAPMISLPLATSAATRPPVRTPAANSAPALPAPVSTPAPGRPSRTASAAEAPATVTATLAKEPDTLAASPASPPAPVEPPPPPKSDERVQRFVDEVRVTGIRSSGTESKVLMNDRVFRVNDIVERSLGIRLTRVAPDSLTFTDANGATYVKNF
jgi:hypothetical protein